MLLSARAVAPALAALLAVGCRGPADRPRTVVPIPGAPLVLISIDTLRADHLPSYGYAAVRTPHLDALRADAVLFENAYSHAPLTLPSHVSLLTGLLPPAHGVRDNLGYRLDAQAHPTLATRLRAGGYATGAAVSAYVLRAASGLGEGFDAYDDAIEIGGHGAESAALVRRAGASTVERALAWLEGTKQRRFLLFVHLYEPHYPYEPPEPFRSQYPASAYDGAIAAADAAVGRLLDGLRRSGRYDGSLVALVADHGEGLGDHGEAEHGMLLYREALHVPLFLKLPGSAQAGRTVSRAVGLADLFPTLLRLLALPVPPGLAGRDLFEASGAGSRIYSETEYPRIHLGWSGLRSLLDGRYHLIEGPRPELYDLERDPHERTPLPDTDARREALLGALRDFATQAAAPALDAEGVEQLRALGYLTGGPASGVAPKEGRPNPRDQIGRYEAIKAAFHLTREGRDEEAAAAFRKLLAEAPGMFDVQWELGATLARLGDHDGAAAAYENAMRLSPPLAPLVALSLAEALVELRKFDAAERHARLGLSANAARGHVLLARIALARRDFARAESECARARESPAGDREGLLALVDVRARQGRPEAALALLDEARARYGQGPGLATRRGDALARLGRNDEAIGAFREEVAAFPRNRQAYASLAILLALQRHARDEVVATLEAMYRATPDRSAALLAADALDFIGDADTAREWRRRAHP